jgi:hypothetical protein
MKFLLSVIMLVVVSASDYCDDPMQTAAEGFMYESYVGPAMITDNNDYGCLTVVSNPTWFYFEVAEAGDLTIDISAYDGNDSTVIDYVVYGPFDDPETAMIECGDYGAPLLCSTTDIQASFTNLMVGDTYLLMTSTPSSNILDIEFMASAGYASLVAPGCYVSNFTDAGPGFEDYCGDFDEECHLFCMDGYEGDGMISFECLGGDGMYMWNATGSCEEIYDDDDGCCDSPMTEININFANMFRGLTFATPEEDCEEDWPEYNDTDTD